MSLFRTDLVVPSLRQAPLEVAPDTFVIRAASPQGANMSTSLNAMLIRGTEPVVVDTGMVTDRETFFDDIFSLVEPVDVRWIFITHNDSDHAGNLVEALERCPNACVVASRAESFRTSASFGVPFDRIRFVDNGEDFNVGDRTLCAIRPPVYDSPYTRGLFDLVTRVYYASDAFCAPMPGEPVDWIDEMPGAMWAAGMARFHHHSLCPWVALVDRRRFADEVRALAALDMKVVVGAHTASIRGRGIDRAFEALAGLPDAVPAPLFAD